MMNFKKKPARSPKYLAFIRSQPCCLTGRTEGIDAHHQNAEGHGGKGTKCCDSRAIPIHWRLHNKMESPGNSRKSVFEQYGADPEVEIEKCRAKWLDQGNAKFW